MLLPRLWQLAVPLLMKINADECWTGWGARVSGGEERRLCELTGRCAWFALRCMMQPFASAPYPASVALRLLLGRGVWRLEQSWSWGSQPRQHVSYQYSTVTSADAALMLQNLSLCFGLSLHFSFPQLSLCVCLCVCKSVFFFHLFDSQHLSAAEYLKWLAASCFCPCAL